MSIADDSLAREGRGITTGLHGSGHRKAFCGRPPGPTTGLKRSSRPSRGANGRHFIQIPIAKVANAHTLRRPAGREIYFGGDSGSKRPSPGIRRHGAFIERALSPTRGAGERVTCPKARFPPQRTLRDVKEVLFPRPG